ncbi:hypothetical protein HGA91_02105 [candidate division WWE3 bacterium]|nr:hypothetical protein [candidate division WWE3 bacterium]
MTAPAGATTHRPLADRSLGTPGQLLDIDGYTIDEVDGGGRHYLTRWLLSIDSHGVVHEVEEVGIVDPRDRSVSKSIFPREMVPALMAAEGDLLSLTLGQINAMIGGSVLTDWREIRGAGVKIRQYRESQAATAV